MILVKQNKQHIPVMTQEVIAGLNIKPEGIYLDATFGRGGHAKAILAKLGQHGKLFAFDKDPEAKAVAEDLSKNDSRFYFSSRSFNTLKTFCEQEKLLQKLDGILLDLGVSSPQLDTATRGFSFQQEGPLDMRMNPEVGLSAAEWLNTAEETDISWVLKTYGEERFAKRIARAIVEARSVEPINTTQQLAKLIQKASPISEKRKHPATRSFQAIRIFINQELDELLSCLEQAVIVLAPQGRLAVLSFHSLEDRIVKQFIQKMEKGSTILPRKLPIQGTEKKGILQRVGKKQFPSETEIHENPRARSAVLRVAEKTAMETERK